MKSPVLSAFSCLYFIAQICLFCHCHAVKSDRHIPNNRCFYYWKSEFALTPNQIESLNQNGITRLYVKFFDVDWEEKLQRPVPVAPVTFTTLPPEQIKMVPVVYLTNNTLVQISEDEIQFLADSIFQKILALMPVKSNVPPEIQIDCDWTGSTKDKYFQLLTALKQKLTPKQTLLSSTLRLHQVKFSHQTGIPPVDRVTLMFYNMGDFKHPDTENSILDLQTAQKYLGKLSEYPLPVDVALPLFSWGVVFRNGRYSNLIANLNSADADTMKQILEARGKNHYLALKSTMINGSSVGKGDMIRIEEAGADQCKKAAQMLSSYLPEMDTMQVILFHLDQHIFEQNPNSQISDIYDSF